MDTRADLEIAIVIPCHNEEKTLSYVLQEAQRGLELCGVSGEIIVVDNASLDRSSEIARHHRARVVRVEKRGYGSALHGGILESKARHVCYADADGSYNFLELKHLYGEIQKSSVDFVLGSRLNGAIEKGAMPSLHRWFGTPVLSWLIFLIHKIRVSDCNSGMRMFRRSIYPNLKLKSSGMEYASEMLVAVAREKISYSEIPISYRKDRRNKKSHLRPWRDGIRHLRIILGH